jgi:filamentous hemagglutinin family protein
VSARGLLLAGAAIALAGPAVAQTAIIPDAPGSGFETGTTVSGNAGVTTIDGGRRAGANLFHSFSQFDLGRGETARWTADQADSILNIINRVTGGSTSFIDGTIDSTAIPNANFWFINPAGIVFGDGAQVNVPGAAHFSTAHDIVQADGTRFSTVTPDGSTLSVADPQAFGFLGGQGDIGASGALDTAGSSLSLSAANIVIQDASISTGALTLAAVGDGPIDFDPLAPFGGPDPTGRVGIANANIVSTAGFADGSLTMTGGQISFDGVSLQSSTSSDVDAGAITLAASTIDIFNSTIDAGTFDAGDAGDVVIVGDQVSIASTNIFSDSFGADASGSSSSITILATALDLGSSSLSTKSSGSGDAGVISLTADTIALDFTDLGSDAGEQANGTGGLIELSARTIDVVNGSNITSTTAGALDGGLIDISADERLSVDASTITSNAEETATGGGGVISLTAPVIELTGGTALESNTLGFGDAGAILVQGDDVFVGDSTIRTNAGLDSSGSGGLVSLSGTQSLAFAGSRVEATTRSIGSSGLISIDNTGELALFDSTIASNAAPDSSGDALGILINAGKVTLDGGHVTTDSFGQGAAGLISVTADQLAMTGDRAEISADSLDAGNAGQLLIDVGTLFMESDSIISSSTFLTSTGDFGSIDINADQIALFDSAAIETNSRGLSDGGDITIDTGDLFVSGGHISSNTSFSADGNSGNVSVTANSIRLQDGGSIASDTEGFGDAGNVTISAGTLSLKSNAFISSDSLGCQDGECSASAGSVDVTAGTIGLESGGLISTSSYGPGNGGNISVNADTIALADGRINADTLGCQDGCLGGFAGSVQIQAGRLTIAGTNAEISSDTIGSGDAGDVSITANEIALADGGHISSAALGDATGFSGLIDVTAAKLSLDGGKITTATEGPGDAGIITLTLGSLDLKNGLIASDSLACPFCFGGNAGGISITANQITASGGVIRSDTSNTGDAGFIDISAKGISLADGSVIASRGLEDAFGDAGFINVESGSLQLDGSAIATTMFGFGTAGNILITTGPLTLVNGATINSASLAPGDGYAGSILVTADSVSLAGGSDISTSAVNAAPDTLPFISVETPDLLVTGIGSNISTDSLRISQDPSDIANQAGDILISSRLVRVYEGGLITSSSTSGAAGSIVFDMPADGLLRLQGRSAPGVITTSSGPGTGGTIIIQRPLAIISNGGEIRAQGQQRGAFAIFDSQFFINSMDRANLVAVDGSIAVDASIYDVSSGTTTPTVAFLDASRVLSGQCASARASGETSQLSARPLGPYLRQGTGGGGAAMGGCQ